MNKLLKNKEYLYLAVVFFSLSCNSNTDSNLNGVQSSESVQVTSSSPTVFVDLYEELRLKGISSETRIPFLVYYAVDSKIEEPYMKASIDYEVDMLKQICREGSDHVNWIVLRNSSIVKNKTYEVCRGGRYKRKKLDFFLEKIHSVYTEEGGIKTDVCPRDSSISIFGPIEDDSFNEIFNDHGELFFCSGSHFVNFDWPHGKFALSNNIADFLGNEQEKPANKINLMEQYVSDYPLADTRFLSKIVSDHTAFLHPFHQDYYVPVFHIKSHGHFDYSITGLNAEQLKSKIQYQKIQLDQNIQNNNKADVNKLRSKGLNTNVYFFEEKIQKILDEIFKNEFILEISGLEQSPNVKFSGTPFLRRQTNDGGLSEDCGLGEANANVLSSNHSDVLSSIENSAIESLSASSSGSGLGSQGVYLGNQIGITPSLLAAVFANNFLYKNNNFFTFVEACDTSLLGERWKVWSLFEDELNSEEPPDGTNQLLPYAIYSAEGSLWYRNFDWHNLFNVLGSIPTKESHATILQFLLINLSKDIPNYKSQNQNEYMEKYIEVLDFLKKNGVQSYDSY